MTDPHPTAPAAPVHPTQVYLVEVLPDDDIESQFAPAHVFTTRAAADEYAAKIVAPAQARVTPMPLRTAAPAVVTTYRIWQGQSTTRHGYVHGWERNYDPTTEVPDVIVADETDPEYAELLATPPVTVTVSPYPDLGSATVRVDGTDRAAVIREYARTFNEIKDAALAAAGEQA